MLSLFAICILVCFWLLVFYVLIFDSENYVNVLCLAKNTIVLEVIGGN